MSTRYSVLLETPKQSPAPADPPVAPATLKEQPQLPVASHPSVSAKVGKEGSREVGKEVGKPTSLPITPLANPLFSLDVKPYRKDSFLFTDEEFYGLEQLKLELKMKFDLKNSKQDIIRCAIQHLIEDYKSKGDASFLVRRLKNRK